MVGALSKIGACTNKSTYMRELELSTIFVDSCKESVNVYYPPIIRLPKYFDINVYNLSPITSLPK